MAQVRLTKAWTDEQGTAHAAGATVEVDEGTLDRLKRNGIADPAWIGPSGGSTGGSTGTAKPTWIGPSGNGAA